uniref:MAP7 domain-containing protein n=1 Tax=Anopheles dirus TaxID=7168 RepID=A0A182NQJ7_9DIPT
MVLIDDDSFNESTSSSAIMLTDESDRIPSTTLAVLRGILVKSLSRENLSLTDQQQLLGARKARHVQFSLAGNRDASVQKQSRPSSANRELQKEREERIKQMKERQNEERQKKLEELKAQALAAQKFREQKEEERRRRMDDLRRRESDRRSQVEERRRAIIEADNERREYILRKNQERDQRMETKRRNDRGSIQFAFGSSTPRMIDTSDSGMCSSFWAHRRATSITNVAYTGAALTRRSSERELTDSASKKRATSASGLDRSTDDQRRMSSSMYEVFNWTSTSECPRKLTFSLAGTGINIDDPPTAAEYQPAAPRNYASGKAEMNYQRTVNRRKTDLMPTIPSPRDSSRSSLGTHTPRTPGRAFSMTRLDQLAQPRRRNGEHISAILERERRQALELENLTRLSLSSSRSSPTGGGGNSKRMSRSMSQLAGSGAKYRNQSQDSNSGRSPGFGGGRKSSFNSSAINSGSTSPMRRNDTSKSMSQLNTVLSGSGSTPRITKTERLRQQYHHQQQHQNQLLVTNGLRSGEMTPTSLNTSRPGSAMSSSTTASGIVYRRSLPAQRKPRPASIAVTGVTASGLKEEKPPLPKTGSGASTGSSVTSASSKHRLSSAGSGSIHTTPAKSGTETPTKKPLTLHSTEKRASSVRGTTPKASSTPLQSPGPEKASRNLQDSLKKTADGSKKVSVATEKPTTKPPAPKDDVVLAEVKQEAPVAVVKEKDQIVEVETTVSQEYGSVPTSLVEMEQSFGQEEQPQQQQEEVVVPVQQEAPVLVPVSAESTEQPKQADAIVVEVEQPVIEQQAEFDQPEKISAPAAEVAAVPVEEMPETVNGGLTVDGAAGVGDAMTASMIAKRINTEEEAKAALAERRRLAREEAERLAELERKRIEAEEQAERQRILEEEERLRKLEEDTIRLAEEQRRMEEERLQQAIEEARRRDEEERKRREEEVRQKAEREEAERKAREEAERQRVEMAERLKKEEKEREERRKRVEAIMSRTRAKGTANNTPTKYEKSVTEKESLLLASSTGVTVVANNNHSNGAASNGTSAVESATNDEGVNGASIIVPTTNANSTSGLIIEDALMGQTNGHKNGTMDNVLFPRVSDI